MRKPTGFRPPDGLSVPSGRLSRLIRFGGMAAGVTGGMLLGGAAEVTRGRRPSLSDLLLTPANALRVTRQLGEMRGAAMKIGQLMSMDAGDLLPRELTDILARLRSEAQPMPARQLDMVLTRAWGGGWGARFMEFSVAPIAAASIGQVHRATTLDGRDLAIKVQYPGVRESIDSDVDNVATLLRLTGLLPKTLDIAPLLSEAKRQLREEADYAREGECLTQFGALLNGSDAFAVPSLAADFSTRDVLAMTWADGAPIESLATAAQDTRDRIAARMMDLVLRELFDFGLMQTDPNFANYLYDGANDRVVLLDFGATRAVPPPVAAQYRTLFAAALSGDAVSVQRMAVDIGLLNDTAVRRHGAVVARAIAQALVPLAGDAPFDFGDRRLADDLRTDGLGIAADRSSWHIPPTDLLFVQRKVGGVYLLASRLQARVAIRPLLARAIGESVVA